jgi:murein DD-endopeptidase MepM/ murein hydrolase activator NlpD
VQENPKNQNNLTQGQSPHPESPASRIQQSGPISRALQRMLQLGLGEFLQKAATNLLSLVGIATVVWLAQLYFQRADGSDPGVPEAPAVTALPAEISLASVSSSDLAAAGILREADLHTNMPERARQEITTYTVQPGDTVSGIADRFGLQSKTVFAANYDILQDDPHMLRPDQSLRILPVDGVYWEWLGGIPFSQWAGYFEVRPEDILNYPANKLDPAAVADPNNPNIPVGMFLIIPGGVYQYHTPGQVPLGITRANPASAQVGGAGACPPVTGGAVGYGTFVYPTSRHQLSGFDYSIKSNHLGIDLSAELGDPIYAADGGVVVYAGANGYGYGNLIMIDHGTGFQTLYAHLSAIFTSCGFNVAQGETIGSAGSTGRSSGAHLHFEVRTLSNVINPWDVLPAP